MTRPYWEFPEDKTWTKDVMEEARTFPTGNHDDYMDTISQALLWMRNGGYIDHSENTWLDKAEQRVYNRKQVEQAKSKSFYY